MPIIETDVIQKQLTPGRNFNLHEYETTYREFSWDKARRQLTGLPEGKGLNIAWEAVDRHADGRLGDKPAIRCCAPDGSTRDMTYREIAQLTNRFANALEAAGVKAGDRVFSLCGRLPELYVTVMGTLKARMVFSPLFSAFGPEPIKTRIDLGRGSVLVTTPSLYRKKVEKMRGSMQSLTLVIVIRTPNDNELPAGTLDFHELLEQAAPTYTIAPTSPEDMALLHFTSGTTGIPKGAIHVHGAVVAHYMTGHYALDLHQDDIFWCTADPGWVTGTSYGIIAPLTHGVTSIVDEAEFDADRWYQLLQDQKVNVWYTAPTAIRMLMRHGADAVKKYDLSALRFIASVGEPLNPEAVRWGLQAFSLAIHDNWWQTETGGIMIANYASMPVKLGSMGKPLPGITAAIVKILPDGRVHEVSEPGIDGELALRSGWPSMFRGYLNNEERYRRCFVDGWYLTGDLAKRDADGYYWFVGRADDVIKSAGHLIGPFEVESVLLEHPAVAEAAVIGKPDPLLLEVVKAFVALKPGFSPSQELNRDIMSLARKLLGPAVAPREIEFKDSLPKTRSGKIMRRLLKARELGLPEGDLSTLENPNS